MDEQDRIRLIEQQFLFGCADGLNAAAGIVFARSQAEVPRERGDLAASALGPHNDPMYAATPVKMLAEISYNTVYAAAQHEGEMEYERGGGTVHWVVTKYTTSGTKKHYLEDPLKSIVPMLDGIVGVAVVKRFRKLGI